jgi:hypothetical protein
MARVSLGHDQPPHKFRIENSSQVSKNMTGLVGVAGGKPTASFSLTTGKSAGMMVAVADEEVHYPVASSVISTEESRSFVLGHKAMDCFSSARK